MLKHLIKKYVVWMLLSYLFIYGIIHTFVIIPQKDTIEKYRSERAQMEYNYMKMTGSPAFMQSIDAAIDTALGKARNFEWVDISSVDASLVFYNYISDASHRAGLSLTEVVMVEERSGKAADRENFYHSWKVKFGGNFQNLLKLIEEIETDERFFVIREISITQGREINSDTLYDLVFLCLKKGAYEKTDESN